MADRHGVRRGQIVYGSDGIRWGRVLQCDDSGFVVEKGIVFVKDYPMAYDEVVSVRSDEVHLRLTTAALLPQEETESWDPPPGTAGRADIEPLRAGMAEIDEEQGRARSAATGRKEKVLPRRGERVRRDALAREVRRSERISSHGAVRAEPGVLAGHASRAETDDDLERHIETEVEDYEREGSCEPRGGAPAAPALAGAASGSGVGQGPQRRVATGTQRARGAAPPSGQAPRERGGVEGTTTMGGQRPGGTDAVASSPAARRIEYREAAPGALAALRHLEAYLRRCGLEPSLLELVRLRASQLNGCAYCIDMHTKDARRAGESEQRLYSLVVWEETPFYTARERAALAWTEAVTRVGEDRVTDETYRLARDQFGEKELVDLTMAVIAINGWNRLAIAFRTEPGSYQPPER